MGEEGVKNPKKNDEILYEWSSKALVLSKTYSMHVRKLKDKSMAMQDNEKCTTAWQRGGKANNSSLS